MLSLGQHVGSGEGRTRGFVGHQQCLRGTWELIDIDDPAQFEPAIRRALSRPPELMQAIVAYADSIHPYRDGRSSERVLDAIDAFIAAGARNRKPKPMNLWRKLKIRKRIGYWGPA